MKPVKQARWQYPAAPTSEQLDDYHGVMVADPYRSLEDPAAPETRTWVAAQNALSEAVLAAVPEREAIRARLRELWDCPKVFAPFYRGGRWFGLRNSGLQNQHVLYVMDAPTGPGRVLIDPNRLSDDGTVALNPWTLAPSRDGRFLAYALSESGSDWQTWRVLEVASGQDLDDKLLWSKFSAAAWLLDGSGFFYARYDPPEEGAAHTSANYHQKLFFHKLNSPQEDDALVYARPDQKEWGFQPTVSHDGRYLVLNVWRGTDPKNLLFYRDLSGHGNGFTELVSDFEASYSFVGNSGATFFLRSDQGADRGRLVATDLAQPDKAHWRTLIPESEAALEDVVLAGGEFVARYLQDASHKLRRFALSGDAKGEIALPGLGSLTGLHGEPDRPEITFDVTSFLEPTTPYLHHLATNETRKLAEPALPFDASPYTVRQVFAASADGTQVPMFLVHRKDLKPTGQTPTLLYGYGGFGVSLTPGFAASRLVWLENGGILAVANLRGGGEYGESWHQAGMKAHKQRVFDDFIACAEWLIAEGLTSPAKLAIQGGSNGGLLVGACMTQRPELFGAALPAVGVMDMLRFHRFTIGWAWVNEYGSADDPNEFETLRAYSPLHNLKPDTAYPATLVTTADVDDRVVPAHSYKFAAALQAAQGGEAPVLLRVQTKAGHGLGKPTELVILEQADLLAFLRLALNG